MTFFTTRCRRLDLRLGHLEQQLVMHLQQHAGLELGLRQRRRMRIIARLMMSAAVPWSGALIAARSMKLRRAGFLSLMPGMWQRRPKMVLT